MKVENDEMMTGVQQKCQLQNSDAHQISAPLPQLIPNLWDAWNTLSKLPTRKQDSPSLYLLFFNQSNFNYFYIIR